jgi:hypothetical protein
VTLTIDDPQSRVLSVRFRIKQGDGLWEDWVTDTTIPYSATVPKVDDETSEIEWRVRYYDATPAVATQGRIVSFGPGVRQAIAFAFGNGLNGIPSNMVLTTVRMPFDGVWTKWTVTCPFDATPDATLDIWTDAYGNFPPTVADSICASEKPKVAGTRMNESEVLAGWQRRFNAGDVITIYGQSFSNCRGFTLTLDYNRYQ